MKKYTHSFLVWLFLFNNSLQSSSNNNIGRALSAQNITQTHSNSSTNSTLSRFFCCCFHLKKNRIEDHKQAFKNHALKRQESMPKSWYTIFYTSKKRISNKTESQNKARISGKKTEELAIQAEFDIGQRKSRSKSTDLKTPQDSNYSQKSKTRFCSYNSVKKMSEIETL